MTKIGFLRNNNSKNTQKKKKMTKKAHLINYN